MANLFDDVNSDDMGYLLNPDANGREGEELQIPMDRLVPFHHHPFKVDTEAADFQELLDSIREHGLIYAIIVRPAGDQYEILAGHRRYSACKELGMTSVKAMIRNLDDFEATTVMVHSNFYRETVQISEKAKAYRMCLDAAEKHSGKKGDDVAAMIGGDQDSKRSVYRYVRLSYLDEESQRNLQLYIEDQEKYPTMEMAAFIQSEYEKNYKEYELSISYDDFVIMFQQKEESPEKKTLSKSISLKRDEISGYFDDDADTDHMKEVILTLLQRYHAGEFGDI